MLSNVFPNFNSKVSFKVQLLSFFIFAVVALSLAISVIGAWRTSQLVKETTIATAIHLTSNFADKSVLSLLTESEENAKEGVDAVLGFNSVSSVAIFRVNGELLTSSSENNDNTFFNIFSENKNDNLSNGIEINMKTLLFSETSQAWLFSSPVIFYEEQDDIDTVDSVDAEQTSQLLGYVVVEYDKDELHAITQSIFISNLLIGIFIAAFLTWFVNRGVNRLIRPLLNLSSTMKQATDSKHYPQAPVSGSLEVRQMATVYNQMMVSIESQNQQLKKHRDTLESEVAMRTEALVVARDTALTANRHKSEFLANISHELRTPLQAIIGYSDLVKEELELECMDVQVEDLNKSIRNAHTLLALINNILDIAKIEAGKMDLYLKPVLIKQLIEETLETIKPLASVNNNILEVTYDDLADELILDRQKVMQIFLNLLSNACKFSHDNKILFTATSDEHYFNFSVKDSGIGIDKEQLSSIFEQFTQADGSETRNFEGTGLGMAITQNFCHLMKGEIRVESELGKGSLFTVQLPLNKQN